MGIRINTNLSALNAQRFLGINQSLLNRSLERLSSGLRINRAADDAAGLAIATKLLVQTGGIDRAIANTQDSINLVQTAESGLDESTSILQRIRELALQSANDTLTQSDRSNIQVEVNQLTEELTRIGSTTQFNTRNLLDGSISSSTTTVNSSLDIKQNARVGDTTVTTPSVTDLIQGVASVTTSATSDVAFQLEVVASSTPGSFNLLVRSSLEGVVATLQVGPGSALTQISLTVSGVAVATINIDADNIATNDIGDTALVQLNQQRTAVTTDNALTFQVGAGAGDFVKFGFADVRAANLKVETINLLGTNDDDSRVKAQNAIGAVDNALSFISTARSRIGAFQNRLESTVSRLSVTRENLTASLSRIRDTDISSETTQLTRAQILIQANIASLSQANISPRSLLDLL